MPVQRGLAQECQQHFQTSNLYEIFSLNRTATDAQGMVELRPYFLVNNFPCFFF